MCTQRTFPSCCLTFFAVKAAGWMVLLLALKSKLLAHKHDAKGNVRVMQAVSEQTRYRACSITSASAQNHDATHSTKPTPNANCGEGM